MAARYSLKPSSVRGYRFAVKKFEEVVVQPFENVYLDKNAVQQVLNVLNRELEPSTWYYLTLYKRFAKSLSDLELGY